MNYVENLLKSKRGEYQTLLDLVNSQIKDRVFRSKMEWDSAYESKAHYEGVLRDIDEKLKLIGGKS